MYPFIRLGIELFLAWRSPKLPPDGIHISHHTIMPWDIDFAMELNNGRTLTIYDLGRLPLAVRIGIIGVLRRKKWNFTMAGVIVRYRRRITAFMKVEMHSQAVGRDARFIYIQQTMYHKGEAMSSVVYRVAAFTKAGIVPTDEFGAAMGHADWNPEMPDWLQAWADAEAQRPWPPVDGPVTPANPD